MINSVNNNYSTMSTQIAQKMFKKLDANSDGGIDKSELAAISSSSSSSDIDQIFAKMDTDGDGKISESETESALQKISDKMGSVFEKISKKGNQPPPPPPQSSETDADDLFSKLDTNGDGGIDEDEFSVLTENSDGNGPSFSDIDADGDGKISKTENEEAMKNMPPPQGGAGAQSTGNSKFSDLLSALKSTLVDSDDDDSTSESIQQLFNELKTNVQYSSQANLSVSTSTLNNLFQISA